MFSLRKCQRDTVGQLSLTHWVGRPNCPRLWLWNTTSVTSLFFLFFSYFFLIFFLFFSYFFIGFSPLWFSRAVAPLRGDSNLAPQLSAVKSTMTPRLQGTIVSAGPCYCFASICMSFRARLRSVNQSQVVVVVAKIHIS